MNTAELQNSIIKKILSLNDKSLLEYFNNLISNKVDTTEYELNDFEKRIINESLTDYKKGNLTSNDDVFSKTNKWLEE